ncbi:MAG: triple tyrosine motif-containing protein [Robiginitalea sp.]
MKNVTFLFTILLFQVLGGQVLPPIQNFQPREYQAENQNWGITQSADGWMYFANNGGLLEFNGVTWNRYPSPNGSVLRSVMAREDRIYAGCYMEFGFWQRDPFGGLAYTSLSDDLQMELLEDEQFWKIRTVGDWVLFQSLQRIYAYRISDGSFEVIPSEASRAQLFTYQDAIYFQREGSLFRLENGKPVPLVSADSADFVIVGMVRIQGDLVFVSENGGFFELSGDRLIPRNAFSIDSESPVNIYSCLQLMDGHIALGTISQGVFLLDATGMPESHINKENGLNNNTVLALAEDSSGNLWLGLDNGISVINRSSAFREFNDPGGRLGVVYAASVYRGHLYLGTNQGLFRRLLDSSGDFEFIRGTEGQVWSIRNIDGTLFCGHNQGTFLVRGGRAELISDQPGTWDVKKIPGRDSLLLQGNYQGLSVLARSPGGWEFRNSLTGFDISSRFFEFTHNGKLIVNHEYKGVYTLKIDEDFQEVSINRQRPPWGVGASLFKYGQGLYYATDTGLYEYSDSREEFVLDSVDTKAFMGGSDKPVGILVPDPSAGRLWGFGNGAIHYLDPGPLDTKPVLKKVDVPADFRPNMGVMGFECLTPLGEEKYLIGRSNGFVILDLEKLRQKAPEIQITGVHREMHDQPPEELPLNEVPELRFEQGNISIEYAVPEFGKFREVEYQYRLKGYQEEWGQWTTTPEVTFSNLPYGDYDFEVRARVGEALSENPAEYSFLVLRPWYLSYWAIGGYVLAFFLITLGVNRLYKSYYQKQQRKILEENRQKTKRNKLKAKKKIMEIQNAKLQQEIEGKNRELAVSTMSLIKKNEFLNTLKDQLKGVKDPSEISLVIKTIDRNIGNEDDWKFFEEAFNNADKDFLHKVKELHPDLTPNDLKLCAYLRLNLSSKEIAPLLNISVRSVEVKRYRLRKKMDLPHEKSLTTYILEL